MKEIKEITLEVIELEERIAPTANGSLGYEGQPGNQGNGLGGYEGQPGNQGGECSQSLIFPLPQTPGEVTPLRGFFLSPVIHPAFLFWETTATRLLASCRARASRPRLPGGAAMLWERSHWLHCLRTKTLCARAAVSGRFKSLDKRSSAATTLLESSGSITINAHMEFSARSSLLLLPAGRKTVLSVLEGSRFTRSWSIPLHLGGSY